MVSVHSSELETIRLTLAYNLEQGFGLLGALEARLREHEQFEADADTVLEEAARTGEACGIVKPTHCPLCGELLGDELYFHRACADHEQALADCQVPCPECNNHDSRYCRTCDGIGEVPAKGGAS